MAGSTRGCDLWREANREEIYRVAYGDGEKRKEFNAFNKAMWQEWNALPQKDKDEWGAKAKAVRESIHGQVVKVKPPVLTSK